MSPDLFNIPLEQIYAGYLMHEAWASAGVACFIAFLVFLLALMCLFSAEVTFGWKLFDFIASLICGACSLVCFSIMHTYPAKKVLESAVIYRISASEHLSQQQKAELIFQFQATWNKR